MPPSRPSRFAVRWVAAAGFAVIAVVVVLIIALSGSRSPIGYDISYPQCSGSYPSKPLFGIVGVNGGLSNTANPCLGGELHWARGAAGQRDPRQPPLSLYIDTGTPAPTTSRTGPAAVPHRSTPPVTAS